MTAGGSRFFVSSQVIHQAPDLSTRFLLVLLNVLSNLTAWRTVWVLVLQMLPLVLQSVSVSALGVCAYVDRGQALLRWSVAVVRVAGRARVKISIPGCHVVGAPPAIRQHCMLIQVASSSNRASGSMRRGARWSHGKQRRQGHTYRLWIELKRTCPSTADPGPPCYLEK